MKSHYRILPLFVCLILLAFTTEVVSQEDVKGCKDHPLLTRMPNFFIRLCEESEFDRHDFSSENGPIAVEGKKISITYFLREGVKAPSVVAIVRNYVNAVKKIGGTVVYDGGGRATLKVTRAKQEVWVGITVAAVYEYRLDIVEKGEMQQEVAVTTAAMINDITSTGHAALYGIFFDTGKSEIKPESEPALKEIARMLKQDATMKLFVVGHTDNVGGIGDNMTLSKARAESVVKELTIKLGANASQLASHGVGSLSPVASNSTEAGRALNRRVELVAQ